MEINYSQVANPREGSISVKEFQKLNSIQKLEYLRKLMQVEKSALNLWDQHILKYFTPEPVKENKHFISLK